MKMRLFSFLSCLFFLIPGWNLYSEVLIITCVYNRSDFIEMQYRTFQKFLQDDYRFVVFNDAVDPSAYREIRDVCNKYEIECIDIPQEIHSRPYLTRGPELPWNNPNVRHSNCLQYAMNTLGFQHQGPVAVLDSDVFLIRPFSIEQALNQFDIAAVMRGAITIYYLWPGLMFFSMDRLPDRESLNFNCGLLNGESVDAGGYTYNYLISHPEIKYKALNEIFGYQVGCPYRYASEQMFDKTPEEEKPMKYQQMGFNRQEISFIMKKPDSIWFLCDNHFLHYGAGSGYEKEGSMYHQQKTQLINDFLDEILSNEK
jgi:hypothetical protein